MQNKNTKNQHLTWAEIDLRAVKQNLRQIVKLTSKNKFHFPARPAESIKVHRGVESVMAVIKADAYGHGIKEIGPLLDQEGVGVFGVSDVREGVALRNIGIKKPILLFESTLASDARQIVDFQLMPTICTPELAAALNRYARLKRKRIDVHVKVDTGMGRLGIWYEEAYDFIKKLGQYKHLRIMGIFTHFPSADTDRNFTIKQLNCLYELVKQLDCSGLIVPYIHAANSMGLAGYQMHIVNLSRPGLMLYGLYPHASLRKKIRLKPVMNVKSRVIFLKKIMRGRSVSYGRTFFTKKDMMVATVPIGYNDGYFRIFSNRAHVLIDGKRCLVIGRVTMDQIMVDVSRVKDVRLGSLVTILGSQKKETVSADELADLADTINYEIVCSLGNRLPKIFKRI